MLTRFYNDKGQELINYEGPTVKSESFYTITADGEKVLAYPENGGFDLTHKEPNGSYKMRCILKQGTHLIRYGSEMGSYTAPLGSQYCELGLPWEQQTAEYHEDIVIADEIHVKCIVLRGKVAPAFDSPGGAIQYIHPNSILLEIKKSKLRRIK